MIAIGNGESRKDIDLNQLQSKKVGCNAIFRDYKNIDHIICVDRRMVKEAIESNANEQSLIYTRQDWHKQFSNNKRIRTVPELPYVGNERWDEPFQWGSGPYAVLLAAKLSKERQVRLIGFDLYSKTKTVNNIYKSTQNYDNEDKRAVDPRYWIHQIGMVFKCFTKTKFTIYQDSNWEMPTAWKGSNVTHSLLSTLSD